MSKTVYPVGGGLEDWGYGAGWDNHDDDATLGKCSPKTYKLAPSINMSKEAQKNVKSLIYLVETDNHKSPPEWTLGGRRISKTGQISGIKTENNIPTQNGHINRNIRLTFSMLEMIDPWISILGYQTKDDVMSVYWKVNGCATHINMAQFRIKDEGDIFKYDNNKYLCSLYGDDDSKKINIFQSSFKKEKDDQ